MTITDEVAVPRSVVNIIGAVFILLGVISVSNMPGANTTSYIFLLLSVWAHLCFDGVVRRAIGDTRPVPLHQTVGKLCHLNPSFFRIRAKSVSDKTSDLSGYTISDLFRSVNCTLFEISSLWAV
jgi:hypothetical protein